MGKVIKGSAESAQRYTLTVPSMLPAPPRADGDSSEDERQPSAAPPALAGPAEPAVPAVDLEEVHAQAQKIIDDATHSAQSLVDDAHSRAQVVLEDAANRGQALADDARRAAHDDGYASGVHAADAAMAGMLETLHELVDSARTERQALLTSAEPELVRLSVGIAERVLHQQIALDRGVVVEMAKAAIARIVDREKITVRVNPADIERMRQHRDELLALGDVKTMLVIEDQRVDRGGVVIETDAGSLDAKISTQLGEVRNLLHIVDDVVVQPAPLQAVGVNETPLTAIRAS